MLRRAWGMRRKGRMPQNADRSTHLGKLGLRAGYGGELATLSFGSWHAARQSSYRLTRFRFPYLLPHPKALPRVHLRTAVTAHALAVDPVRV